MVQRTSRIHHDTRTENDTISVQDMQSSTNMKLPIPLVYLAIIIAIITSGLGIIAWAALIKKIRDEKGEQK